MNRNVVIGVIILIVIGIGATYILNNDLLSNNDSEEVKDDQMSGAPQEDGSLKETDDATALEMKDLLYQLSGPLVDVTKSVVIRGVNTNGEAAGIAKANFDGDQYLMVATFENLPEPQGDDFYEGWIVQNEPFNFISTGVVKKVNGVYMNAYRSDDDLTSHDLYVLTLEPNDGDPGPADHILEGTMIE